MDKKFAHPCPSHIWTPASFKTIKLCVPLCIGKYARITSLFSGSELYLYRLPRPLRKKKIASDLVQKFDCYFKDYRHRSRVLLEKVTVVFYVFFFTGRIKIKILNEKFYEISQMDRWSIATNSLWAFRNEKRNNWGLTHSKAKKVTRLVPIKIGRFAK